MRTAINAAIIQKGKILLVRKNLSWILPEGKPEKGENDLECLAREISEELSGTKIRNASFYRSVIGRTPNEGHLLRARIYFAELDGKLYEVSKGDSVSRAEWVSDFFGYNLSNITEKAILSLRLDKYV